MSLQTYLRAPKCPGCGNPQQEWVTGRIWVCQGCDAIHGECALGDSYVHVRPRMADKPPVAEQWRYFDFRCHDTKGLTRRHGWFDPKTRLICQVG